MRYFDKHSQHRRYIQIQRNGNEVGMKLRNETIEKMGLMILKQLEQITELKEQLLKLFPSLLLMNLLCLSWLGLIESMIVQFWYFVSLKLMCLRLMMLAIVLKQLYL
jgi:hypothetical protein